MNSLLPREEYVEQAHLFRALGERLNQQIPLQEMLEQAKEEILPSTNLPYALDYLLSELRHSGQIAPAMRKLPHYFTHFQTYLIHEAELDHGRFDFRVALEVLHGEAKYRIDGAPPQGIFLFQLETLCRNRLRYDHGLDAMAADPAYNDNWRTWIQTVRRQLGIVDLPDLIYVRSEHYWSQRQRSGHAPTPEAGSSPLFGEKEGRIALANRQRDPLLFFAALQRHLGYPAVPRPDKPDETAELLPQLLRRVERFETRLKMLEEEQRHGAVDLTRFYPPPE